MRNIVAKDVWTLLLALMAASCAGSASSPSIEFDVIEVNAGKLVQGEVFRHSFSFVNGGPGNLTIERLATDCRCAAAAVTSSTLLPMGAGGRIDASFDSAAEPPGQFERFVTVFTNSRGLRERRLRIYGRVESEFRLSQLTVDFGDVRKLGGAAADVFISTQPGSSAAVVSATSSHPESVVAAIVADDRVPPGTVRVNISIVKGAAAGWLLGNVVVQTTSRYIKELRIPVRGRVVATAQ